MLYNLPSIITPLNLDALFDHPQPLEVELGCGDGTFLVESARLRPGHNFIGVERLLGRIRKVDRRGRRLALANLRAVRVEAAYFLRYLLPPHSVAALHVYFPDPWPKAKHERHRLVRSGFASWADRVLTDNGCVLLRTDDENYFEAMVNEFSAATGFRPAPSPPEIRGILTDFEREFLSAGRPIYNASYTKSPPIDSAAVA